MLTLLTAALAVLHLTGREPDAAGTVRINGTVTPIRSLPLAPVTGTVVNGKGQETHIDADGVSLAVLFDCDVTVISSDSYRTEVAESELDRAYLILDGESLRLVVFGDADAKRNVKNVAEVCAS